MVPPSGASVDRPAVATVRFSGSCVCLVGSGGRFGYACAGQAGLVPFFCVCLPWELAWTGPGGHGEVFWRLLVLPAGGVGDFWSACAGSAGPGSLFAFFPLLGVVVGLWGRGAGCFRRGSGSLCAVVSARPLVFACLAASAWFLPGCLSVWALFSVPFCFR